MLAPVMNDAALFSKLFGMENSNAARALVQSRDELARLTEAITGTESAEEQAAIIMDSYAERQARVIQQFEDIKNISVPINGRLFVMERGDCTGVDTAGATYPIIPSGTGRNESHL